MATNIKKCLYVGIGGTGMKTLLETKKFFIETYGEVPPCIAFLGIDTDGGAAISDVRTRTGEIVSLSAGEFCAVQESKPRPIFDMYKNNVYTWMPPTNVDALQTLTIGAGQVRSNGRFAFSIHYNDVKHALERKLSDITSARNSANAKYQILPNAIDVNLIFSLGGGTGCGSFIDVAYLIQQVFSHHAYNLWPYALLPNIFRRQLGPVATNNVFANAYGALSDLDYLMGMNAANRRPMEFKYTVHNSGVINCSPFDIMIVIDDKDEKGKTYSNINQLTNMLGLALVTTAGDFGANIDTPLDNARVAKSDGTYTIENKDAWICAMGMSQILFDGELLAKVYSIKALRQLIASLRNVDSSKDVNALANSWIAKPEVLIREDQGQDNVINYLLEAIPETQFAETSISNNLNAQPDVDSYMTLVRPKQEERENKIKAKLAVLEKELKDVISDILNDDCGIGTSQSFINEVLRQIDIWEGMMKEERTEKEEQRELYENKVRTEVELLKEAARSSFIGRGKRIAEAQATLVGSVNQHAILIRESFRREGAITLYAGLKSLLTELGAKLSTLSENLLGVEELLRTELDTIQNVNQSQSFVYPLHSDISRTMIVDSSVISVNQLAKSVSEKDGLFAIFDDKIEIIQEKLLNYSDNLPQAVEWKGKSIDDILETLSPEEYNRIVKLTIERSTPLLSIDYKGRIRPELFNLFIVGTPDTNTILNQPSTVSGRTSFADLLSANHRVEFTSTGNKNSILIYRLSYVIPPFALSTLDQWEEEYMNKSKVKRNCHLDFNMEKLMKDENFSLHPRDVANELSLELWVKSFIFGRITNEGGIYKLYTLNRDLAKAIDGNKCSLNDNSNRREDAYRQFEKIFALVKDELEEDFAEKCSKMGQDALYELYEDVKANYYKKYAQTGLTIQKLNGVAYKDIKELVDQELEFVASELN